MRVVVADNQADVRAALRLLLTHHMDMRIVAEVAHVDDLQPVIAKTQPDLLLLDWGLLDGQGPSLVPTLRSLSPELRLIVLSGRPESRGEALGAGADGFLSKTESADRVIVALQAVAAVELPGSVPLDEA